MHICELPVFNFADFDNNNIFSYTTVLVYESMTFGNAFGL